MATKILIVDDSAMNRLMLKDIVEKANYQTLEAEDGEEALKVLFQHEGEVALILLDAIMPKMDGFTFLHELRKAERFSSIPVIMISSENESAIAADAFELGVSDFINRPYDVNVVSHRIENTLRLFAKQKSLVAMVAEQIYERGKNTDLMIAILSHIVEFRNGESGMHVLHVAALTRYLLEKLTEKGLTDLSEEEISLAATASSLHDIGKISIPEEILNKPGRFTPEEFEQMKKHTTIGAKMLEDLPFTDDVDLIRVSKEIVRWHHERWDGKGYPDGLKGNEIPIVAQVVALADVFDALTSERVYKPPFSPTQAVEMILKGECGAFNPALLEVLKENASEISHVLTASDDQDRTKEIDAIVKAMADTTNLTESSNVMDAFEYERTKHRFFASMSDEMQYEFTEEPAMLVFNDFGDHGTDIKEVTYDPENDKTAQAFFGQDAMLYVHDLLHASTVDNPIVKKDVMMNINGHKRWMRVCAMARWDETGDEYLGSIGKIMDITEDRKKEEKLEWKASHDALTNLYNRASAETLIRDFIQSEPYQGFALLVVDVDDFKTVNDTQGHLAGDKALKDLAEHLERGIRHGDIVARVGGDEFLVFARCTESELPAIARRMSAIAHGPSISVGAAMATPDARDYKTLFGRADAALYAAKGGGKNTYVLWDETMGEAPTQSAVGPIDKE